MKELIFSLPFRNYCSIRVSIVWVMSYVISLYTAFMIPVSSQCSSIYSDADSW